MGTKIIAWQFSFFIIFSILLSSCARTKPIQDFVPPIDSTAAKPIVLTEEQKAKLFNVAVYQSCRENGLKLVHIPTYGSLNDYTYKFESLDSISLKINNNYCVLLNSDGRSGRVKVTITKGDVQWFETIKHSTCNHDGQPTECPENSNLLTVSNLQPTLFEVITVTWGGKLQSDQFLYYYGEGYKVVRINSPTSIDVKILAPFFHIQMQPSLSKFDGCHGWSAFSGNIVK